MLARCITLLESTRADDQRLARKVLEQVSPHSGRSLRIGVSGMPGAGKSSFIDTFGCYLTEQSKRLAVLAVDPSSTLSGGSVLGDRTRMNSLASCERAFVRPSPSRGELGGVAARTREAILLCEAAGYDVVFVETVGVGQSEALVASMVDFLLLLVVTGAGDELQAVKRGVIEHVDLLLVTKADGDNRRRAEITAQEYAAALALFRPKSGAGPALALPVSSFERHGIAEVWQHLLTRQRALEATGEFERLRCEQRLDWMWNFAERELLTAFRQGPRLNGLRDPMSAQVAAGQLDPTRAALLLVDSFLRGPMNEEK